MNTHELRKAAMAVFLAVEEDVARDLSAKLNGAADEIDRLRKELQVAAIYTEYKYIRGAKGHKAER